MSVDPRPLLNERQVAARLAVSVKVLQKWRALRKGPPFTRLGPMLIRYYPDGLDEYIANGEGKPDQRHAA